MPFRELAVPSAKDTELEGIGQFTTNDRYYNPCVHIHLNISPSFYCVIAGYWECLGQALYAWNIIDRAEFCGRIYM